MIKHKLTKGQEIGYEKIRKFLKSKDRVFILTGRAGTGKTTLLKEALKEKIDNVKKHKVIGVTVSHKAKGILRQSIPYCNTFASTYGYKEQINGNRRDFIPDPKKLKKSDCKKGFEIFVIDECSQISDKMLKIMSKETSMYAKIIFVGDRGQTPPVLSGDEIDDDKDSPVFYLDIPEYCKHELTEIVRQGTDSPIISSSSIIYDEIFGNQDIDRIKLNILKENLVDNKGIRLLSYSNLPDLYKNISEDYMDAKVIAYRNNTVNYFNKLLRDYIYNNPKQRVIKDEVLFMNDTYEIPGTMPPKYCYNSDEYYVTRVHDDIVNGINVYMVFVSNKELDGDEKWFPVVKPEHFNKYKEKLKYYADSKDWKKFWWFKQSFADFSSNFGMTVYKSQGSTYKNVFVDMLDILSIKPISKKRKLQALYTAVTRASDNVYILINE